MNKKFDIKKRDIILIAVVSVIVLAILVFSLATRTKGSYAFVKYGDSELFRVKMEDGKYESSTTSYTVTSKPLIDGDDLIVDGAKDTKLQKGKGVIVFKEGVLTHFYILGFRGYIHIEYCSEIKKIRVVEEDSPYHICSNLGFTDSKPIICLPNLVSIVFDNDVDKII